MHNNHVSIVNGVGYEKSTDGYFHYSLCVCYVVSSSLTPNSSNTTHGKDAMASHFKALVSA